METSSHFDAALPLILAGRGRGPVLDLASGRGRHALACTAAGLATIALDRDLGALRELAEAHAALEPVRRAPLLCVRADIETEHGIPVESASCGAILVFNFLFRPLAGAIMAALAPGGLLVYETFTTAQRGLGYGPKRDAFLLAAGELRELFPGLEIVHFEEGRVDAPRPRETARLIARRRL